MSLPRLVRFGLLGLCSLAVLAARLFWADGNQALWFQSHLGYYWDLALLLLAGWLFVRAGRKVGWFDWRRWHAHRVGLLGVLALSVFLHLHEAHVLRVFYDEPSHAACALAMHLDKRAMLPTSGNYVGDVFLLGPDASTYRQYLYPLLVSLLHDLTGYRIENLFVVNVLLTPVVLLAAYLVAWRVAGKLAGWTSLGLLGTLPLLAENVTSGGYDVLSLALLGSLTLFTIEYARSRNETRTDLMELSLAVALLLAVSRYEAVLYLVPWIVVTVVLWWRERLVTVTWFAALSPFFLLPNLMSGLRMMNDAASMYTHLRPNGAPFFSLAYLPGHLPGAIFYFFSIGTGHSNLFPLSLLGLLGFVALPVVLFGVWRRSEPAPTAHLVAALFAGTAAAVYLFVLTMFWSDPNDPNVARLSLGLQFEGAVLAGWFLAQVDSLRARPWIVILALAIWTVLLSGPAMSRGWSTYNLIPGRAGAWVAAEAAKRDIRSTLYVAPNVYDLLARRYAVNHLSSLNRYPQVYLRALKAGLYREVLISDDYEMDIATGQWRPNAERSAHANIVLEPIAERVLTPLYKTRLSRLIGYRKADGTLVTPASDDSEVAIRRTFKSEDECMEYGVSLYP